MHTTRRLLLAPIALCLPLLLAPVAASGAAGPHPPLPPAGPPAVELPPPTDPGPVQGLSQISVPHPPPVLPGRVRRAPVDRAPVRSGAPGSGRAALPSPSSTVPAPDGAAPAAALTPGRGVQLRALVLATDADDLGLAPWTSTLDRVGAGYDVLLTGAEPLTRDRLVAPDGTGRYNAVLLTSGALLRQDADGTWSSSLDATGWNTLWDYERDYAVRQATLFGSYGTWPEETCLRGAGEGGVDETGITASLTPRGAQVFDYLAPDAALPVQLSWVYRNRIAPGCPAEPLLRWGDDVLGVTTTTPDGREQASFSFSFNENLLQSPLLAYGLFRWASRGMFLGEQRHYLKLDVDDFFNSSDLMLQDLTLDPDGFSMTGSDAVNMRTQQSALRASHPLAGNFRLTLAYNGQGVAATSPSCAGGGEAELVAAALCVKDDVEWINHTYTHADLNDSDLRTTWEEITRNRRAARNLGLSVPGSVLKTGEYSGLGVYNPDPDDDIDPPTDFGLPASNPALIQAAVATGTTYLHGNMSFASHRPSCFNCNIRHPMDPRVRVVPDWPTNIAYFSSTPAQETAFYNWYYGPQGRFPYWPVDQTYAQILDHESSSALQRLASGSIYTSTMHIPNLSDYGGGRTLAFDWLQAVVSRYEALYSVPLITPSWVTLARTTDVRSSHFAVKDQVVAVWDPASTKVRISSPVAGQLQVTGMSGPGATSYGTSTISTVTLQPGSTGSWTARPLP